MLRALHEHDHKLACYCARVDTHPPTKAGRVRPGNLAGWNPGRVGRHEPQISRFPDFQAATAPQSRAAPPRQPLSAARPILRISPALRIGIRPTRGSLPETGHPMTL